MVKLLRGSVSALLLAGCVSAGAEPPETRTAIKRYYEAYASENIGQCLAPYIDGFTGIQVIESGPERTVLEVRYMYRDRVKDQEASGNQGMRNVSDNLSGWSEAAKSPRAAWQASARAFRPSNDGGGPPGGAPGASPRRTERNPCCTPRMWATRERISSWSRAGDLAQAWKNTALAHSAWANRSQRNGTIGNPSSAIVRDRDELIVSAGAGQ